MKLCQLWVVVAVAVLVAVAASGTQGESVVSIASYGAVSGVKTTAAALGNSQALASAFQAVAAMPPPRRVVVPASGTYYVFNTTLANVFNTTLQIDGHWIAMDELEVWPVDENNKTQHILGFTNTINFNITGSGTIDGQGYLWWVRTIVTAYDNRPNMLNIELGLNTIISGITMRNSPQYHMYLDDMLNLDVHSVTIRVDVEEQKALLRKHGHMKTVFREDNVAVEIPTFPLNTDGIDPRGTNVHIYNCSIENFDDAVAVKPMNGDGHYSQCSQNVLVEDLQVTWGVGMTIGSVPPDSKFNCVKDVVFRNVNFTTPIKGIYVKTNPGEDGYGIISNITYENLTMHYPVWWGIYIGPQQQEQPGGHGPGCMIYPIDDNCPTQPRVPIYNVTLRNVVSTGGELSPGIIRCNATKPCTGFVFDNVHVQGSDWPHHGYICENIYGSVINSTPNPGCFQAADDPRRRLNFAERP